MMKDVMRLDEPQKGLVRVRKTSESFGENPPCDGAFVCEIQIVDRRTTDDPAKIPAHLGKSAWWYDEGTNHRIENGQICRDMGLQQSWFVRVGDIMEFVRKYGTCVVSIGNDGHEEIEIYDDYRE